MSKVLITGGTGLIGKRLSHHLAQKGYQVSWLSRTENLKAQYPTYGWNIQKEYINSAAFENLDYIIHLAGAGIADKRWSDARKKVIIDSRVESAKLLAKYIEKQGTKLKAFVGGSAIGFYGDTGDKVNTNESEAGTGFLSVTTKQWEASYEAIRKQGIRTPLVRTGVVLSTKGGALSKMLPSYKVRVGAYFGDGQQYYSWIHLDDICQIIIFLMENEDLDGVYNGVAPNPVTNKTLAYKIAEALDKKALIMPAPAFAMRAALGEMSAVVLDSTRVIPNALQDHGFKFEFPELVPALRDIIQKEL